MSSSEPSQAEVQAQLQAKLTAPPATRLDDSHYKPKPQPFYVYSNAKNEWELSQTSSTGGTLGNRLRLLSWNIDVLIPYGAPRMSAALKYLEKVVSGDAAPTVVFFQEMSQNDLKLIQTAPWVQSRFAITDIDHSNWDSPMYGTVTLLQKELAIAKVFRVPWVTKFERDGLFVDIQLPGGVPQTLRLCNTHLESLVADPPVRPLQLQDAAKYMHDVHASILAGDLNAIQPFDRTMVNEYSLKDVYLELGGKEDNDDGYTWGIQVPGWMKQKFGPSRMDKILYVGQVRPVRFERIGIDVKVEDEDTCKKMRDQGIGDWVTDHFGVMAELEILGSELATRANI